LGNECRVFAAAHSLDIHLMNDDLVLIGRTKACVHQSEAGKETHQSYLDVGHPLPISVRRIQPPTKHMCEKGQSNMKSSLFIQRIPIINDMPSGREQFFGRICFPTCVPGIVSSTCVHDSSWLGTYCLCLPRPLPPRHEPPSFPPTRASQQYPRTPFLINTFVGRHKSGVDTNVRTVRAVIVHGENEGG